MFSCSSLVSFSCWWAEACGLSLHATNPSPWHPVFRNLYTCHVMNLISSAEHRFNSLTRYAEIEGLVQTWVKWQEMPWNERDSIVYDKSSLSVPLNSYCNPIFLLVLFSSVIQKPGFYPRPAYFLVWAAMKLLCRNMWLTSWTDIFDTRSDCQSTSWNLHFFFFFPPFINKIISS